VTPHTGGASGVSTGVDPARLAAEGYDVVEEEYAALEEEEWPRLRWLRLLLDRLPPGSFVLDLGCGNGLPAGPEIVGRGHALLGVDVSARQVELAREHVPSAAFIQADMATLELAPGHVDAVVSFYAIGHVPREEHAEFLRRVHGWLRSGGLLLLSEEDADRPGFVGEWLGVPMFLSTHDAATLRRLVEEAGFAIERTAVETQREQGHDVPFTWILARKLG
jgi:cyclopropane fatty-acyl-phospholipid synthase-like methyltransferase